MGANRQEGAIDVIGSIQSYNANRDPERLALKYGAMRGSVFAFLRGSCHLYYAQLPRSGPLKSAPLAWNCGDLHLANFGSYKGDDRLVYFDINDFDEAALAPATWDVVRLLSSLNVATAELKLGAGQRRALGELLLNAYADALAVGKASWLQRETATGVVGELLTRVQNRQRPAFLDTRTRLKGRSRRLLVDTGKALPATARQVAEVTAFMQRFAASQAKPAFFEVLDVARRIAGTGSLGVERYAVLVRGKATPDGNYLLDLKLALPSSWTSRVKAAQPQWPSEAQRVVSLQQRLQAMPIAFLQAVQMDGRPFVLRALHPSEDRIDFKRAAATPETLADLLRTLGRVTAWAQLRSAARQGAAGPDELIDFGRRQKWRLKLLDLADAAAEQVRKDATTFNAAYDAGAFKV
jgi:uncharacterized protein (DUF2252 family)